MSLLTCCIVSDLCIYTTVTAAATKIKKNYHFRSNINGPLRWNWKGSLLQNLSRRYELDFFVFVASFVSICDFVEKTVSVLLNLLGFAVQCWTKLFHFPLHRTNTSHCILHKYFNWRPTTGLPAGPGREGFPHEQVWICPAVGWGVSMWWVGPMTDTHRTQNIIFPHTSYSSGKIWSWECKRVLEFLFYTHMSWCLRAIRSPAPPFLLSISRGCYGSRINYFCPIMLHALAHANGSPNGRHLHRP